MVHTTYSGAKVIAEYVSGALSKEYIYLGSQLLATLNGSTPTYHHQDHLSVRVNTNSSGSVVGTQGHHPFGESWYSTSTTTKWQFTSYERDSESGLDYAIFRYSNSRTGRFMQPDLIAGTIFNPQSLNRYAYVLNDPINLIDPLGLQDVCFQTGVESNFCPLDPILPNPGCVPVILDGVPLNNCETFNDTLGPDLEDKLNRDRPDGKKKDRLAECKTLEGRAKVLEQLARSFLNNNNLNQFVKNGPSVDPGNPEATVTFKTDIRREIPDSTPQNPSDSFRFPGEPSANLKVKDAAGINATIDFDRFNTGRKDLLGVGAHFFLEVLPHFITGSQTNPCKIRETLISQERFNP